MQTTFLSALFLTALGYLLTYYGIFTQLSIEGGIVVHYSSLQFSGAVLSAIFWVC